MTTAAEQLAAALQRVIEEAVERVTKGPPADTALKLAEAGRILGYSPSFIWKLCKTGQLESTGTGKARRVPMSACEAYKARTKNGRRKVRDFSTLTEDRGANVPH